jgi:protocatechuate 3,4-dioxygenase beta subunit
MRIRSLCTIVLVTTLVFSADNGLRGQQIVIESSQTAGEAVPLPGLLGRGAGMGKTGTGRITGRILSAEGGTPLRRAIVRLTAPEVGMKTALTDADGRYEFKDLPAGRFSLNASKPGYVNVQYGQLRPFEQGRPIELAEKHVVDKADITMPRGGVISGRITDEFGEPVADALVSAMRQMWANGRRRLVSSGRTAQTNDLGQFRLYGLPPGEYFVSGTLRNTEFMAFEAMVGAGAGSAAGSTPASGYAATYFPGTTAPANAQRVTVPIGQEAQNTDFALTPVRLARISGTVVNAEGKPVEGTMVNATPVNSGGEIGLMMMGATGRTSKDGTFTISNVAPGDYTLNVRPMRVMTSDGGNTMMFSASISGGPGGIEGESATLPVTVAGEDLTNVVVMTSKGATATGRVVFEGTSTPPSVAAVRITSTGADTDGPLIGLPGSAATADGSFELKGLTGRRMLRTGNLPQGWTLKSVRLNGEDITDAGTDFKPGQDVSGLEVVLTSKLTEISGGVTASNGTALKDYTVVVFADDPQLWNLPATRWVNGTRPDQEGRFRIRNMPAGSYYAVALEYIEQGSWGDPELLDRLKTQAKRFTLGEGGTENLDLKIAQGF